MSELLKETTPSHHTSSNQAKHRSMMQYHSAQEERWIVNED